MTVQQAYAEIIGREGITLERYQVLLRPISLLRRRIPLIRAYVQAPTTYGFLLPLYGYSCIF